jgi:hypothetical protein
LALVVEAESPGMMSVILHVEVDPGKIPHRDLDRSTGTWIGRQERWT